MARKRGTRLKSALLSRNTGGGYSPALMRPAQAPTMQSSMAAAIQNPAPMQTQNPYQPSVMPVPQNPLGMVPDVNPNVGSGGALTGMGGIADVNPNYGSGGAINTGNYTPTQIANMAGGIGANPQGFTIADALRAALRMQGQGQQPTSQVYGNSEAMPMGISAPSMPSSLKGY